MSVSLVRLVKELIKDNKKIPVDEIGQTFFSELFQSVTDVLLGGNRTRNVFKRERN